MRVDFVRIEDIDVQDRTFFISSRPPDPKLKNSIESLGQLNPIKLIEHENFHTVITGWERIKILIELGKEKILAQIYNSNDIKNEFILKIIYADNRVRFSDLEKCELLSKFAMLTSLDEEEIMSSILPFLGLNPSRKNLQKHLKISNLQEKIKRAYMEEQLSFEQLDMLSNIQDEGLRMGIYENIFSKYRFNNNETRDLLKDTLEILNRDRININDLTKNIFDSMSSKDSKNEFRKIIKSIRYPHLSKIENIYQDYVKELNFPNDIKIKHHQFFEVNEIELNIKVRDSESLKRNLEKINSDIDSGKVDKVINLVKEGE